MTGISEKGVPVVVRCYTTVYPEEVEAGTLRLVGTEEENIYRNFKELLEDPAAYEKMSYACNPYGDGNACKRIADVLEFGRCDEWVER